MVEQTVYLVFSRSWKYNTAPIRTWRPPLEEAALVQLSPGLGAGDGAFGSNGTDDGHMLLLGSA